MADSAGFGKVEEVTPLEKLLYFSNGVKYALNGELLIFEECQSWMLLWNILLIPLT